LPIPPIERIPIFSDSQWDDFVLEWADLLRDQYGHVERCGSADDIGRDIMPHPGFVLVDSPLVVYREPDTDEGGFSHDVKDAFYQSIAEDFRASQVIIFENEDPPSELGADANIIRFTGAFHGRQGFIPKSV
jgi:hypothetical protein